MKPILITLIIVGILGGGTLLVVNQIASLNLIKPPSVEVFSSQTVLRNIKPLGELMTLKGQFAKAGINVSVRFGAAEICGVGADYVTQGTVRAAVDLTKITEEDIQFDTAKRTLTVTVPQPYIAGCSIDFIDEYNAGGSSVTCPFNYDDLRQVAQYIATIDFREQAKVDGLLDSAKNQSQVLLESFLQSVVASIPEQQDIKVSVVFETAENTQVDATCRPPVPAGWAYDEAEKKWSRR